jgi:two-component system CheB/CheR fusion protein
MTAENGVSSIAANPAAGFVAGVLRNGVQFQSDHFRQLVENLPVALYATDAEGRLTYFNDAAAQMWGRSPRLGEEWWCGSWRLFWPDGRPMAHEECPMAVTLKTGRPALGAEAIAERPDGSRFAFTPYPAPIYDVSGTMIGAVNMLFDISGLKASEQAARHLAAIVESSDDAIISKNLIGTITSWNRSAEKLFGYTSQEIIGKSIVTLIPPDRRDEEATIIGRIRRGERIEHYETVRLCKDGSRVEVSLTVSPVKDGRGVVVGASKIARDITDRRQSERIKEFLLNEIKHRVKNTLSTVQAMAVQTFRKAPPDERSAFVARLHALSQAHDVLTQRDWGNVDLGEMATRALGPFTDSRKERVSISGVDAELGPNRALLVAMVLHELGTNAVKYGALSNDTGSVDLLWSVAERDCGKSLTLRWTEAGGPPVTPPVHRGFGSRMIEHAIRGEQGSTEFAFTPEGLACTIEMPI